MTREQAIEELKTIKQNHIELNYRFRHLYDDYMVALDMAIKVLKQNRWIPCSERLPKKDEEVLIYLFRKQPYIAWHNGVNWCTNDFKVDKDDEPLAWMPLPQPYKAESEDRE